MKELWCDGEKATGTLLPSGGVGWLGLGLGRRGASTAGAGRSSEVSPPHSVTNPSGASTLHTPSTSLSFRHLGQLSEDPPTQARPQARTETPSPPVTASRPITSHLCRSLLSPSSLASFFFFPASGFLCSFCVYRTFTRVSPRHTPHVSTPPLPTATPPWSQTQAGAQSGGTLLPRTNKAPYSLLPSVK